MSDALTETTRRHLTRVAIQAQRDSRTPALVAGVARRGELVWHEAVGTDPAAQLGDLPLHPRAAGVRAARRVTRHHLS